MWCIDIAFVYSKWVSTIWCIKILLFLIDAWCWWHLKQKKSLKHLSKQSLDDIRCSYMWDILAKVFIFSGCQLCTILTDISGNKASTKIRIDKLGKMFTLIWIICWKTAHRSFSFVKNNLTFRLLKLVNFLLR